MWITKLTLWTQNFQEQQQFYTGTLGLPLVEATTDAFTIQAGRTRLTFKQTEEETLYHFAFTIPSNKADAAKAWLLTRFPLLARDGQDQFFSENWNSLSFYFRDAANHILECIIHHDLHNDRPGVFGATDLLHISEIGMACENVPEQVKTLNDSFTLEPYRDSVEEKFAAIGDIAGLFINVQIGRNWMPTSTAAIVSPVEITIEGVEGQSQQLIPYPYKIQVQ